MSDLERSFLYFWRVLASDLIEPEREYRFCLERKFRFDFAWIGQKVAVEIEGGTHRNGRHNRAAGYEADCIKYNLATALGWRVLRYTGNMLTSDPEQVIKQIRHVLSKELTIP